MINLVYDIVFISSLIVHIDLPLSPHLFFQPLLQIEKHSIPTLTQPFCHGSFVEENILEVPLQQKQKPVSMAQHYSKNVKKNT